ncbi:1124_t:CDS:2 [Ambispora gerdemannii]|uniref:5-demethoxyubiquinone hydroxylase, mitochondrial n=1 Tax=Ambispora gerdemannii TaxID=144530 RepID=A0A9N9FEZ3_9GLOM|nr:1124_t:CDS:2 [Ambispora gerdemannii]
MHLLLRSSKPKNLRYLFVAHHNHIFTGKLNDNLSWRSQHTAAGSSNDNNPDDNKTRKKSRPLTEHEKSIISSMIRVDHAGEIGADWIYRGQMAVLGKDKVVGPVIQEMWDQEKYHLSTFDEIISRHRVRPTFLRPIWETTGFLLGAGTALLGKEAAMACTEAVETTIGEHYNDQLRELIKFENNEEITELTQVIKKFRDDELHHLDTAVDHDAQKAPFHGPLTAIINNGCKAAIWIATRI